MTGNAPDLSRADHAQRLMRAVGELQDCAKAALERRVAGHPQDAEALLRLGGVLRRSGDFAAACGAYRRLRALRPGEGQASWLQAIMAGEQLPAAPPEGIRATPFLRIRNFLSPAEADCWRASMLANRERFEPGGVGLLPNRKVRLSERRALEMPLEQLPGVRDWFLPKLRRALPRVSTLMRIQGIDQCRLSLSMVAHPDGGFGAVHDDGYNVLSGICYFHREPRSFSGGDLLLYDTEVGTSRYFTPAFSRLSPVANSIVFYPGGYMHEVTPVVCGAGDLAAVRLSVVAAFYPRAA